jgi:hypothetical protein
MARQVNYEYGIRHRLAFILLRQLKIMTSKMRMRYLILSWYRSLVSTEVAKNFLENAEKIIYMFFGKLYILFQSIYRPKHCLVAQKLIPLK